MTSAWYLGAAQLLGSGVSYILLFALTRMGAERYGLWVLALLLVSYLTPWATLGLANALIRFCPTYAEDGQRRAAYLLVCRASLWFSGAVALAMALVSGPLAAVVLGGVGRWPLVVLAAVLFPLEAQFLLGNAFLQSQERLGLYALLTILRYLGEVVALGALVWCLPDLRVMLGAKAAITLVLVLVQHQAAGGWRPGAERFGRAELQQYLRFGFPMIPATFIWGLIMGLDRFLLEHLGRLSEVAIYNVADVVAVFLLNYTRPINGILQPRLANLIDRDAEEVGRYLAGALKYLALLLFPGAVGMALTAGPLVRLVSHPGFENAAGMVPVLAIAYVLIGLSNPLYHLVFLRRGSRQFPLLFTLCLGVNVGINLLLIPRYGGWGAAVATLGCFATYVGGLLVWSEPQTLRVVAGQWRTLGAIAGCSLAMAVVLGVARRAFPGFDSLVLVPLGVVVYGGMVVATGMISPQEWQLLIRPLANLKAALGMR